MQLVFELTGEWVSTTIPPPLPGFFDTIPGLNAVTSPVKVNAEGKTEPEEDDEPLIPYGYLATIVLLLVVCVVWFTLDTVTFYFRLIVPNLDEAMDNADLLADDEENVEKEGEGDAPVESTDKGLIDNLKMVI